MGNREIKTLDLFGRQVKYYTLPNGCMVPTLAPNNEGYYFTVDKRNGRTRGVHSLVCEAHFGAPSNGEEVLHNHEICSTPGCINHKHLHGWGTRTDNMLGQRSTYGRKVTKDTVIGIYHLSFVMPRESVRALCLKHYGVDISVETISDIKNGKTWGRITGQKRVRHHSISNYV